MNFKIGDRIKAISAIDGNTSLIGKTGTIVGFSVDKYYIYDIGFDEPFSGGHSCFGRCPNYRGRMSGPDDILKLIDNKKRQIDFIMSLLT